MKHVQQIIRRGALAAAFAIMATIAVPAYAVTIAAWEQSGQPGDQAFTPGTGSANVTAVDMSRGAGLSGNAGANSFNSAGFNNEATDYIEFGLTIDPGYEVDLDELIIATRASNTGPGFVGVYTSLDSYTTPVTTFAQSGTSYLNSIVDLSGLGNVSGSFLVRLVQIGSTSANGGSTSASGTFRVSDYFDGNYTAPQITGATVSVPEPSTVLLLGLGGVSLMLLKRRRTR